MNNPIQEPLVPENEEGKAVDLEETITEKSVPEAVSRFRMAYSRVTDPSIWKDLAGAGTASFSIWRAGSNDVTQPVQVNDYLRIDIPGPGPSAGEGFDWVKVEALEENNIPHTDESFVMRLRACSSPENENPGTAHFFTEEATSTFILKRQETRVTFSYHGRNEKANTSKVDTVDKIRNKLVATGAEAGLSEFQWTGLLKGVLKQEKQ